MGTNDQTTEQQEATRLLDGANKNVYSVLNTPETKISCGIAVYSRPVISSDPSVSTVLARINPERIIQGLPWNTGDPLQDLWVTTTLKASSGVKQVGFVARRLLEEIPL